QFWVPVVPKSLKKIKSTSEIFRCAFLRRTVPPFICSTVHPLCRSSAPPFIRYTATPLTMAKTKTAYRCTECGAEHSKWQGRCDTCGEWNTLAEEIAAPKLAAAGAAGRRIGGTQTLAQGGTIAATPKLREVNGSHALRWKTGLDEFDFVLGGGIVPGSMILIGGEPGIGKSTLLLQV